MASRSFWRQVRILALLLVLLFVAVTTAQNRWRTTDWNEPLWVAVHPINGDASDAAAARIRNLSPDDFTAIEQFMQEQARHYGVPLARPVQLHLAESIRELPPPPPASGRWWQVALWSLHFRYWAWDVTRTSDVPADIELFVIYHDGQKRPALEHSYGLEKALVGVAHVFADRGHRSRNQIVITHELLHTLGATDKYDPRSDQPLYPDGYAEPLRQPPLPQHYAEIMAGRIPLSPTRAEMPAGLEQVLVGPRTAAEIGW